MDKDLRVVKFVETVQAIGLDPKDPRVVSVVEEILGDSDEGLSEPDHRRDFGGRIWGKGESVWFYSNGQIKKGVIARFINGACEIEDCGNVYAARLEDLHCFDYESERNGYKFGNKVFLADPVENQYAEYFLIGFVKGKSYSFIFDPKERRTFWTEIENIRHV